jgi:hypothetical protein
MKKMAVYAHTVLANEETGRLCESVDVVQKYMLHKYHGFIYELSTNEFILQIKRKIEKQILH